MPSTAESLAPIYDLLNKVLELGELTITCENGSRAMRLRQYIYEARSFDRKQTLEMYKPEDVDKYGKSVYDPIGVDIEKGKPKRSPHAVRIFVSKTGPIPGILSITGPGGEEVKI